ncbi:Retinoic acid induced 16-like protein-domain-containing protein [Hysterangium stoloniferum]|nr:Retinoic acid induced 16-like protein-domain-containing protein [Hysterangium stoloniferum]
MEYFSKFLRAGTPQLPKSSHDHVQEFNRSWQLIKNTLQFPDERQLTRGITATDVPAHLKLMVDSLVWESTRTEEGTTGQCLEYLLKNDVLGNLVRLSEADRPFGIQAQVLRSVANMVVLLDEQFLVHSAVHKAVLRLLRCCVGDQIEEQVDGKIKPMGAASNAARGTPSEYEEDLVDLLCILCSRIRNYRELLMIFFYDKHWFQSHLQTVPEEDEDDEDEGESGNISSDPASQHASSPSPSNHTSSAPQKTEYEFLLFNYLLRFVHREGRIGDFARAGLLFLMDVAMSAGETTQYRLLEEDGSISSSDADANAADPVADAALALAEYVLDGDFSDVLGAGLGAVYSLLPSKLEVRPDISHTSHGENNGMMLGIPVFGTEEEKQRLEFERERNLALGLESSMTPEFKSRLDHFLKLLEFLQDVLRRNVSSEQQPQLAPSALVGTAIVQSILDAVRSVFLENILYTSILECSETDGSAVAVMSYIDIMIRTLADSQLGELLVNFLMSEDDHDSRRPHPRVLSLDRNKKERERARKIRRKSSAMVLLEMEAPDSRKQTDYFTSIGRFTLKDLIFSNLRSPYQPSVTAALQLLQSLLTHHSMLCIDKLLVTIRDPDATSFPQPLRISASEVPSPASPVSEDDDDDVFIYPGEEEALTFPDLEFSYMFREPDVTFVIHELEMGMYFSLISCMGPTQDHNSLSTGYGHYLNDALLSIQSQSAFRDGVMTERSTATFSMHHRLNPNDPLLGLILKSLRGFFSRSPESNIALTGVLAALASDPYRSLAGWLTFNIPKSDKMHNEILSTHNILDDGDDRSVDFDMGGISAVGDIDLIAMPLNETLRPVLYSVLLGLVAQLDRYRAQVENFDKYLIERRQGLLFSENLNDALSLALEPVDDKSSSVRATNSATAPTSPVARSKQANKSSSLVSFLTPKKKATAASTAMPTSLKPTTPPHRKVIAASPFGPHYQETGAIAVQPLVAPLPASGPWSPARKPVWSTVDEDVFTAGSTWRDEESDRYTEPKEGLITTVTKITLSQLLDNVVILEESIKELMAIIQARRSLGIDSIRYM